MGERMALYIGVAEQALFNLAPVISRSTVHMY